MCKHCKKKLPVSKKEVQHLLNNPDFQLMNDFLSLAGRFVKQRSGLLNMTDEQREMIIKIGETADEVKNAHAEIIQQN